MTTLVLTDHTWRLKYTPEDGDLVKGFYIPALEDAERYDRLTGYFNAGALALAARGIEGNEQGRKMPSGKRVATC